LSAPVPALAKGVVLNFSDVDIATMVKFISDLTGKNFIMDDRVKGKISVFSPAKLTSEEAFNVFTSVLELKGFTLVKIGKIYKVVPTSAAKQAGMAVLSDDDRGPVNESYVARVISLEDISAQEAVTFLQPVVSKDGHISSFGPANMLLVVDSSLNIQKILGILELIDISRAKSREKPELVFLKNAGAESTATIVREWLNSKNRGQKTTLPQQPQTTSSTTGGQTVVADTRLNAIVIFGDATDKEDIKKLVALIDVVPPTSSSKINVYYLENADATEVGKVIDGVLKGNTGTATTPGAPAAGAPQQSAFEGSKINVTPDKGTNSLVVMASPADYQSLLQVIQKLDRRRRQVFVEAMIAEVSIDKLKDLGVKWSVVGGGSDGKATAIGQYDSLNALSTITSLLSGLSTAGLTIPNLSGTAANFAVDLKALESYGVVNVLSTPTILTSDNKEAEIFVGENVPFKTKTDTTGTGISSQSIERKDTGITLKITPQISEGEYIKLDIYQEISAVKDATSTGAAADITTTKRSAKTGVVVRQGETVVIGGLIQDKDQTTDSKIPLLGDIPLLGYLFKYKNVTRTKTNLMILLTPRVIKDARDLADSTDRSRRIYGDAIQKSDPVDIMQKLNLKQ
jgi:general secretion pathway protein D